MTTLMAGGVAAPDVLITFDDDWGDFAGLNFTDTFTDDFNTGSMDGDWVSTVAGSMVVTASVGVGGTACLFGQDVADTSEWQTDFGSAVENDWITCDSKQESGTSSLRDSVLRLTLGAQGTGATDDRYLFELVARGAAGGAPDSGMFVSLSRVVSATPTVLYADVNVSAAVTTATVGTRTVEAAFKTLRLKKKVGSGKIFFRLEADFGSGYTVIWEGEDASASRITAAGQQRIGWQGESAADTLANSAKCWIDNVIVPEVA